MFELYLMTCDSEFQTPIKQANILPAALVVISVLAFVACLTAAVILKM